MPTSWGLFGTRTKIMQIKPLAWSLETLVVIITTVSGLERKVILSQL